MYLLQQLLQSLKQDTARFVAFLIVECVDDELGPAHNILYQIIIGLARVRAAHLCGSH